MTTKLKVNGYSKIYALLGCPVEHTASCAMHNAAFEALNINACYIALNVEKQALKEAVASLRALNIAGANITIPHKQACLRHLDEINACAKKIGAVNTIKNKNGKLTGYNTDADGFIDSLKIEAGFNPKNKIIFIMGAGGAARAAAFSLAKNNPRAIYIRDIKNGCASVLAAALKKNYPGVEIESIAAKNTKKERACLNTADMFVNATGVGLKKKDPAVIDVSLLKADALVCDLIYNPQEPILLKAAKKRGLKTLNGEGMLFYQGIRAFKIWTGKSPPVGLYKKALRDFLKSSAQR